MTFKDWDGQGLDGFWLITYKIDGVQCLRRKQGIVSKNFKPLYNFPPTKDLPIFDRAEVFVGNWNDTMSIVRASKAERRQILPTEVYPLYPVCDPRLIFGILRNPSETVINSIFKLARKAGYEGLVLRQGEKFIKVKDKYTVDVPITGFVISDAKTHKGLLKEFETPMGNVGTGFTKAQRAEYLNQDLLGTYIEVEAMEITENGKFRHPRFIRLRPDK